jgi:ketosteroid isomerase-like protein
MRTTTMIAAGAFLALAGAAAGRWSARSAGASASDRSGIEELHRLDLAATVPGDTAALAALWTEGAVRINPGGRVDVGKAAIRAADERQQARSPRGAVLSYTPEIKDLQIAGDWAFEWGEFGASFRESPESPVQAVRGKVLRVLQRQPDGAWKFARVMVQVR